MYTKATQYNWVKSKDKYLLSKMTGGLYFLSDRPIWKVSEIKALIIVIMLITMTIFALKYYEE